MDNRSRSSPERHSTSIGALVPDIDDNLQNFKFDLDQKGTRTVMPPASPADMSVKNTAS
jgi:hypothetical protein